MSGFCKYYKQKQQQFINNTWVDTGDYRKGELYETDSTDCGYVAPQYRWYQAAASDYICSGTTKYYKEYYQVSYDSGTTWTNVIPEQTRTGNVIEYDSTDCGYVPPIPKFKAAYSDLTSYSAECDSNTSLTTATTKPSGYDYSAMTSAEIGDCITAIGNYAFSDCTSLSSVTIPSGVTKIWYGVFSNCTSLTSINIPDSVTDIYGNAFSYCSNLTGVTIPSGVTRIWYSVFMNCYSLTSIDIPSGVTRIDDYAFAGCSGLTSITIYAATPPSLGSNVFYSTYNFPIYVPAESVTAYQEDSSWSTYSSRIQAIP